jgi:hypothetical protein
VLKNRVELASCESFIFHVLYFQHSILIGFLHIYKVKLRPQLKTYLYTNKWKVASPKIRAQSSNSVPEYTTLSTQDSCASSHSTWGSKSKSTSVQSPELRSEREREGREKERERALEK